MACMLLGAVWGLATSTRLVRGEEEAGRWELLLAGGTTRAQSAAQAVVGLGAGVGALWVVTALLAVATGRSHRVRFEAGASMYFALALVATALMFAALGTLCSQLAQTRRQAVGYGAAVLGAAYAVRLAADSGIGLTWLRWASPLGWVEELSPSRPPGLLRSCPSPPSRRRPPRPPWCWPAAVISAPGRWRAAPCPARTPGSCRVRRGWPCECRGRAWWGGGRPWPPPASCSGSSPGRPAGPSPARRCARCSPDWAPPASGPTPTSASASSSWRCSWASWPPGRPPRPGPRSPPVTSSCWWCGRCRDRRWFAGRLALAAVALVVAGVLAGLCAWLGAAAEHAGVGIPALLEAGLNAVAPAVLVLGAGGLAQGLVPRATTAVTYAVLGWSLLVVLAGGFTTLDHWVLDTSIFHQMAAAPAVAADWRTAAAMAGAGVVAAAAGVGTFAHRDLTGQ